MDTFDETMEREQRRIDGLKRQQAALQREIHSTEAYMHACVREHYTVLIEVAKPLSK